MANRRKLNANAAQSRRPSKKGVFRIIGGQHKGRKLNFTEVEGLRPSLDRVRETLFNWLQADIHGAKVLDLFAGSGALGIEALSRGAEQVQFIELNKQASSQLANNLELLQAENAQLVTADALKFIATNPIAFDIILLDPPFHQGIAKKVIDVLSQAQWLNADSLIYLETEQGLELKTPEHWQLLKDKKAGQLLYKLYRVSS